MVALDRRRRPAGEADALDHVGIKRPLRQEFRTAQLRRFLLEYRDKLAADELALGLGVSDARKPGHEAVFRIDHHQRDIVMVAEQGLHLFALIEPQQTMIDKHAGQLAADRLVDQNRGY